MKIKLNNVRLAFPALFDPLSAELAFSRCGRERLGEQLALVG